MKKTNEEILAQLLRIPAIPIPEHRFRKTWARLHKGKVISVKRNQYE